MKGKIAFGLALFVVLLVLAAAGCGSDGADQETAGGAAGTPGESRDRTLPVPGTPGAELPEGHPPLDSSAAGSVVPPAPGSGTGSAALTWDVPEGWIEVPPASAMRRAQYRVPGDAGEGECVVFYFGPGQGGGAMANAERWATQFAQPDGSDPTSALKTRQETVGSLSVLHVETTGTYSNPMTADPPLDDAMLLAAIVEGPDANWFFKLTGPRATVEAQRDAFGSLIGSVAEGS